MESMRWLRRGQLVESLSGYQIVDVPRVSYCALLCASESPSVGRRESPVPASAVSSLRPPTGVWTGLAGRTETLIESLGNGVDSSFPAGSSCDGGATGYGRATSVVSVAEEGDGRDGPSADLVECRSANLGQSPFTEGGNERSADTRQHDVMYDPIQPGKYSHVSLHRFLWLATNGRCACDAEGQLVRTRLIYRQRGE